MTWLAWRRAAALALLLTPTWGLLGVAPAQAAAAESSASCPPATPPLDLARFQDGLRQASDHGFLWRLMKDGRTSYLYGTIHAARDEWMFPGPRVAAALGASDVLALELDLLDPDILAGLAASARARPDEALPPALQERIDQRMVAECIDPAPWRTYAPEFQIASLAVIAARREGFDPAYAIDVVLALVARQLAKPVVSLETPEGQMAALRLPSRAATIEFVESSLDDLDRDGAGPMITRLVRAWTEGDLADLSDYGRWCECLRNDGERTAMKRLLDDRNPVLATAIDALHARGQRVFAAVGSLHLIGPDGLPVLLALRGFEVVRVPLSR
jgi:uncharacterized protein YbaP (TraB family)